MVGLWQTTVAWLGPARLPRPIGRNPADRRPPRRGSTPYPCQGRSVLSGFRTRHISELTVGRSHFRRPGAHKRRKARLRETVTATYKASAVAGFEILPFSTPGQSLPRGRDGRGCWARPNHRVPIRPETEAEQRALRPGTASPHWPPCYASVTLRTDSSTTVRSPEVAPWASKRTFDNVSSTSSMPWTVA